MSDQIEMSAVLQINSEDMPQPSNNSVVNSAEELKTLLGPQMVCLKGYHSGSNKGGGTFIYSPESSGLKIGDWLYQPGQTVTPYHFGALESGWENDSGEALQAFFTFCSGPNARDYTIYCAGEFGTNIPLFAENMRGVYGISLSLMALVPMDDVLTFKYCRNSVWMGKITVRVSDGDSLRHRYGVNGVRIEDCREAQLPTFNVSRGSGWGVYFGDGNNNMCTIGNVSTLDMGASGKDNRSHIVEATGYDDYDINDSRQWTKVQLSGDSVLPSVAHQMGRAFWISTSGYVHKIISLDRPNNSIKVYPRVPDIDKIPGNTNLCYGGAVMCYSGGHTAKAQLGYVSAVRSGIGLWLTGPSTANVQGYAGQFCGVDMVLGSDPASTLGGSFVGSIYFEAAEFADLVHVNQTSSNSNGTLFGSSAGLDPSSWVSLMPKRADWTPGGYPGKQFLPIAYMDDGKMWGQGDGGERSYDSSSYTVRASSRTGVATAIQPTRNTTRLHIVINEDEERHTGIQPVTVHVYGRQGENGSYHESLPITCSEGYTLNGKEGPLIVPNMNGPYTIHAILEYGYNWIVTITRHEVL